jgi:CubicO group peptidase (beta-lactamase class C family)
MPGTTDLAIDLADRLRAAVEKFSLPGAAVAVLADGEVTEAAAGVLNARTGVEVTTDSLFQIGSITKVYTATLVMQLVDAGEVDLDEPVRTYVPEFRVKDEAASSAITVRHLLTHTSGFDGGDYFYDTGRGDDSLARYVDALAELDQITPPGAMWSYNNAAFTLLGRLVEKVTGQTWDAALRDRLLLPAGLLSSVTLPEEALLFRTAAGHVPGPEGKAVPVKEWGMQRSSAPAGAVCASPADVIGFARIHLSEGRAANGNQVLSPASVKAMQQVQVELPGADEEGGASGLAWLLGRAGELRTVSHNGGTVGQAAFLVTVPERAFAVCLLTNGPTGGAVWQDIAGFVFDTVLGVAAPTAALPEVPAEAPDLDLAKYVGTYVRRALHTVVTLEDDHLVAEIQYVDIPYELTPPPAMPLKAIDAETFVAMAGDQPAMAMKFFEFDDEGRPQLFFAARAARRRD